MAVMSTYRDALLGGQTVHHYGAEHQGDDGENAFAFHLLPLNAERLLNKLGGSVAVV